MPSVPAARNGSGDRADATTAAERERHWESVYVERELGQASWHQLEPRVSLALIQLSGVGQAEPVVDIGGGDSLLVDRLVHADFSDVTVLDLSQTALDRARRRLGPAPATLLQTDVLTWRPLRGYRLWHDRAAFHFLVDDADRDRYVALLHEAVAPGGHVVLGTFAPNGPEQCSGLPVRRFDEPGLAASLGRHFVTVSTRQEVHRTPQGAEQPFTWLLSRRTGRVTPAPAPVG